MGDILERHVSPVNPNVFSHLASVLLIIGTLLTVWFFIYVVSRPRNTKERTLCKELLISASASIFLGFGATFLILAVGVYI